MRDNDGHTVETPAELYQRVATAIASVEETWGVCPGNDAMVHVALVIVSAPG